LNGSLTEIPTITGEEREFLLNACRALNEYIKPAQIITGRGYAGDDRPGDELNNRGNWQEILEPRGWKKVGSRGEITDWQRPGKTVGSSATTNHAGTNRLYVFSTNSHPFEAERSYYKFAAYTLLHHDGDWKAATKELVKQGYGSSEQQHSIPYRASSSGLYRRKADPDGSWVDVPLTNFNAQICADVFQDDGVEVQCFTEIKAQLKGKPFQFIVPAKQFQGMQWVAEHLGAGAVLYAGFGSKDHARVAIQLLSKDIPNHPALLLSKCAC